MLAGMPAGSRVVSVATCQQTTELEAQLAAARSQEAAAVTESQEPRQSEESLQEGQASSLGD